VTQQHDVGGILRHIDGTLDRDADVGGVQCGRVVDAVAEIANDVPRLPQREDDPLLLIRFDLREDVDAADSLSQRHVAHLMEVVSRDECVGGQADFARDLGRDPAVVARDHLQGNTEVSQRTNSLGAIGLRWVVQHEEAHENHFGFEFPSRHAPLPEVAIGDSQCAAALPTEFLEPLLDLRPRRLHRSTSSVGTFDFGADFEHVRQRPLRDEQASSLLFDEDAQSLAQEVVRYFVQLGGIDEVVGRVRSNRVVNRVGKAGLMQSIEVREQPHPFRRPASGINRRLHMNHALGQRPRLVGAQDVHAAEVLDRREPSHDDLPLGHQLRPVSQVDHDDRGEELRRQPDSQCEREEERLQHRPMQIDIDREDADDEQQRDLHQKVPEAANSPFEVSLRCPQSQMFRDASKLGVAADGNHDGQAGPRHNVRAEKEDVGTLGQRCVGRHISRPLLDGKRLARQGRFVEMQILRFEQHAIAGHTAPG